MWNGRPSRILMAAALACACLLAPAPGLAAGGGGAEKRLTSAESYVPLTGLSATLSQDFVLIGMINVDVGLDVPDVALRERARRMQPRLQDALRATLAEYAFARQRVGGAPDADLISRMLQRSVDQTLGQTGARVLLANVMVQDRRR